MRRATIAAMIGMVGGVAAIVGPALPWLSYSESASSIDPSFNPGFDGTTISGFSVDPFGLPLLGVALAVAAAWLWAGPDPRKAVAFLGPISLAIGTLCVVTIVKKESALFGGLGGSSAEIDLEYGVYVTLAGAVAGLIAAVVAVLPERPAVDVGPSDTIEMVPDRPSDAYPDDPA